MIKMSHTQRLRDLLEDAIVEGRFPPGTKLDPEALGWCPSAAPS